MSFFRLLFGEAPAESRVSIWTRQDRKTRHLAPSESAFEAMAAALAPSSDVYVGLATRRPGLSPAQRGKINDCVSLGAFWLDVDRLGPGHAAQNLPKDEDDLLRILAAGPDPTMIVDSGGGWHVYWVFEKHLRIADTAVMSERSMRFQSRYIAHAARLGWHLDQTGNLDRVLRVPGTLNHKVTTL